MVLLKEDTQREVHLKINRLVKTIKYEYST